MTSWLYECPECGAKAEGGAWKRVDIVCPFCPTVMTPISPADLVQMYKREFSRKGTRRQDD